MKVGSPLFATRKDRIDQVAHRVSRLTTGQAHAAWRELGERLFELSEPDAPRTPRFNDILIAILAAYYAVKLTDPRVRSRINRLRKLAGKLT